MNEPGDNPEAAPWQASPFEKFTEKTRKVLTLAQDEARNRQHPFMGTEHLLLGLIGIEDGVAARALVGLGVDMNRLRSDVEGMLANIDRSTVYDMGMTPRARKVIELAVQEARRLKHRYIGTEHLLLGLIREKEGLAAKALESFGVTLDAARAQVVQLLGGAGRDAAPPGPKNNVIACRVEDRELDAIDALIEAGICTTRSDAASWLISAGIQASQELLERVYATVSEIRRLRSEAQGIARQIILQAETRKLAREGAGSGASAAAPASGKPPADRSE